MYIKNTSINIKRQHWGTKKDMTENKEQNDRHKSYPISNDIKCKWIKHSNSKAELAE